MKQISQSVMNSKILVVLGILVLAGCGSGSGSGGGSAGDEEETPNGLVETGVFIDSPVANIKYKTSSQSGRTNANGEYSYIEGETVTFSVGGIDLPSVKASSMVTPLDLVNTTDINDVEVVNIIRLLQSLDLDSDPSNGIEIGDIAHLTAQSMTLTFSSAEFDYDSINLISNSGSNTVILVTAEVAILHFQSSLNDLVDSGTETDEGTAGDIEQAPNVGFTKISSSGAPLPDSATQWSCVRDNQTGLMWEIKTPPGSGIHAIDNRYRWGGVGQDPRILGSGATGNFQEWNVLVNGTNSQKLCGFTDWRVPSTVELRSGSLFGERSFELMDTYFSLIVDSRPGYTGYAWTTESSFPISPYKLYEVWFFHGFYRATKSYDNVNLRYNMRPVRLVRGERS